MSGTKGQKTLLEKLPYGIISGACAMFVFFATFGLIVAYVVMSGIAGQTSDTVSFLENSWQVLLFVFDIIFLIASIGALVMFILKRIDFFSKGQFVAGEGTLACDTALDESVQESVKGE